MLAAEPMILARAGVGNAGFGDDRPSDQNMSDSGVVSSLA